MNPGHQQLIQIAAVALLLMHAGPRSAAELAVEAGKQP
jgi:hypothetical protein